ncbi:hypothetical protein CLW00_10698 [Mongoliibacter ruber]|uniref:Uncharacterized protein n=1 Tax=Mongoliibacter ruber TaxID=1750599 RepID=A0A2T0WL89_9BACT|nr:hypothetical protein CLW00_10698 [Mongoliibacter ruber]
MVKIILSNEAEKDLVSIFEFGIYRFGLLQSERYLYY